jgi:deoxyribodipyrimidine photo-lyase
LAGDAKNILVELVKSHGIKRVVWNRCYEPWQIKRDTEIKKILLSMEVEVHSFNGQLLWEPWQVLKKDQTPYKVFTPYYRKGCLSKMPPRFPQPVPEYLKINYIAEIDEGIESLGLLADIPWHEKIESHWTPGEEGAASNLSAFLPEQLGLYKAQRDFPHKQGTSRLSAHLHFGEISPNQVWYAAIDGKHGEIDEPGLDCYLSELGWREFSHYLLYHFPTLPEENFSPKFNHLEWRNDKHSLKVWQIGQTGIPIVDAGMRELWQTGTMQNRVRMLVGSFLVKNLLLDWRLGERWFWDCLVDADLAANSASWQWVAGTGADAAPYFRIFNPVLQGQRFDPHGDYVRQYCPELGNLPDKYIHNPWDAPAEVLINADIKLGVNYPLPIVDLKASRLRALDAFKKAKEVSIWSEEANT